MKILIEKKYRKEMSSSATSMKMSWTSKCGKVMTIRRKTRIKMKRRTRNKTERKRTSSSRQRINLKEKRMIALRRKRKKRMSNEI